MSPTPLDPCLAVVPARGGSKGLPGKNVRPLAGLPLIAHALRCVERVPRITHAVVSTDSEEIAAVARAHGGRVPDLRPAALAQDETPMMPVLRHALLAAEAREGITFASVLLVDPTSPGRLPEDVARAFERLEAAPDCDGAVGCSRPSFNPFWVGVIEREGRMAPAFDRGATFTRRQDVPPFYRICGAVYLWRRDFVLHGPDAWLEGRHVIVEIPEARAFSIDDLAEFERADLLIRHGMPRLPWLGPAQEAR